MLNVSEELDDGLLDEGAPDEPPTGGWPERRLGPRRQEDELSHRMESWVAVLFVHRGKLVFLASIVTFLFTSFGFRILGPSQDIQALDRKFMAKDSLLTVRVDRMEDRQQKIWDVVMDLREEVGFLTYLQCTDLKRRDPAAVPAKCYTVKAAQ